MPAMRETLRTSPFLSAFARIRLRGVGFEKSTVPTATAVRWVAGLEVTETMCAAPVEVRWGRAEGRDGDGDGED